MADVKISELTDGAPIDGTEDLPIVKSGVTVRCSTQDIADLSVRTTKVTLSSAEILALNTTPKTLVAAQGAGTLIKVLGWTIRLNYGTTPYATNTNLRARLGASGHDGILNATSYLGQSANELTVYNPASPVNTATDFTLCVNQPLVAYVQTGDPTAGDSTMDIYVTYVVITL